MRTQIKLLNSISEKGTDLFDKIFAYGAEVENPDAIMVRSKTVEKDSLNSNLLAIARAGAGVNNIPIDACSEKGIAVFNTPGANANGVKELVIAGLFLASRDIIGGVSWTNDLVGKGEEVPDLIEKGKAKFGGTEIAGKKLGVIGLGAIGVLVAKTADALGMEVSGYDPYISQEAKQSLSRNIEVLDDLNLLLAESDFISLHIPLGSKTKGFLNTGEFRSMKRGVKILNFARRELVNFNALKWAIEEGIVVCYITDFPNDELLMLPQVINIPHLGASTEESEDNCAIMAAEQLTDYLLFGNVVNSVNLPKCYLEKSRMTQRFTVIHKDAPGVLANITMILKEDGRNIADMANSRHEKNGLAYTIVDVDNDIDDQTIEKIKNIDGIIKVRVL